jgi:hypothetical protein
MRVQNLEEKPMQCLIHILISNRIFRISWLEVQPSPCRHTSPPKGYHLTAPCNFDKSFYKKYQQNHGDSHMPAYKIINLHAWSFIIPKSQIISFFYNTLALPSRKISHSFIIKHISSIHFNLTIGNPPFILHLQLPTNPKPHAQQ